jgi:protein-tyrosine-phosphatase
VRGPHGEELPGAVLFACTLNSVRSPMAAALMRHLYGHFVFIDSVGVRSGELDSFAVEAMDEIGIAIAGYKPKRFEDLEDASFDLIVTLSPEAHHKAMELTRVMAVDVEYWPTFDATAVEGSRAQRLDAFRCVRDELLQHIEKRFATVRAGDG